jgi:hypothetical protein
MEEPMRMPKWPILLITAMLGAAVAHAQTTGDLSGRITDESGAVLPGVEVEAQSPALQGIRTTTSDGAGSYRFTLLPPGDYTVTFALEGFAHETRQDVTVNLDKGTTLNVSLRAAMTEEITVTGATPVVDTVDATVAMNFDTHAIESLPTARNYSSIAQIAPGVSSDANPENQGQTTMTVYGSSGAENAFYIDGVNTTGIEYGFQGKELNFEFIQELDVKAGGYEAEYGKSTGGIINVITKSGGNEFKGDVFAYHDNDSLQASADPVVSTGGTITGYTKEDFGADLGGYFVKDRLWFFVAYDRVDYKTDTALPAGPQAGEIVTSKSKRDLGSAKLTWSLTQGSTLVGTFFQDPRDDSGAINDPDHRLNGEPLTYLGAQSFGGRDYALRYEGLLGTDWVVSAQAARHEEENSIGPASSAGDVIEFRDSANDFFQTGGFGLTQAKNFRRDFYGGTVTKFLSKHEIKAGLEYEKEEADVIKRMSGGQRVDVLAGASGRPIYRHFYWTTPDATVENAPTSQLNGSPKHENTSLFLQDRWQILPNLTVNFGVRWDRQEIFDRFGDKVIDLKKDYAPRLGFVWDPGNDSRSRVYGSYGRYYEQIPMDLVIRSFMQERQARIFNYSPTSVAPDPAAEADLSEATDSEITSGILGGYSEPADPNLKNQYLNEYILGYQREVKPNVAVGVKAIYRNYGRIVEDFLCIDDGTYCIGNPGTGVMRRIYSYDYERTFPAPKAKRVFKGVQLDLNKRLSDNWSLLASYLYSKLEGNYDGEYSPFTNVGADPNISAMYDYYEFFTDGTDLTKITNDGPLSNDRRHQFKVSGTYITPFKLSLGASAYYRTGTPLTRYGYFDGYGRYELFLTKRGAEGRSPDTYEADLHVGYPWAAGPVTINLMLDVFNVLNAQKPILIDQRWGFQEADNSSPTPVNPNYGKPVLRTPPTSLRLGVRLSF